MLLLWQGLCSISFSEIDISFVFAPFVLFHFDTFTAYQLVRYSYASGLDSFGSQPHSILQDFPLIDMAAARLQKVVIENKDFENLI